MRPTPKSRPASPPNVADPEKLAEALKAERGKRPFRILGGCLLVSFLCGALFVTGIVGAIAVARLLGWHS